MVDGFQVAVHARQRIKERLGLKGKKKQDAMLRRALAEGVSFDDIDGLLYSVLLKKVAYRQGTDSNVRLYRNSVVVIVDNVIVTVYLLHANALKVSLFWQKCIKAVREGNTEDANYWYDQVEQMESKMTLLEMAKSLGKTDLEFEYEPFYGRGKIIGYTVVR